MKSPLVYPLTALAVVLVGGALMQCLGDPGVSDPVASVTNGGPRGLLALRLLLASAGGERTRVDVVNSFDEPPQIEPGDAVLVMPSERSAWTDAEADALADAVEQGAHVVIACDDEQERNERLKPLLEAIAGPGGVECFRADVTLGDDRVTRATGSLYSEVLFVRGSGRVRTNDTTAAFVAWTAGIDDVVIKHRYGQGSFTVLGSATVLANDGLARDGNAAFALRELVGGADATARRIVIDERHHRSRSRAAVLSAAAQGAGPITALCALVLLVPLSLLALVPRPGDAPRADEREGGAPAAEASVRALAALLLHAPVVPRAHNARLGPVLQSRSAEVPR